MTPVATKAPPPAPAPPPAAVDPVLLAGRTRMRDGPPHFTPNDAALLLAAGRAPGFDAEHNTLDAKIDAFNAGRHGRHWRTAAGKPGHDRQDTPEEAALIAATGAEAARCRAAHDAALGEWFAAMDVVRYWNQHPAGQHEPDPDERARLLAGRSVVDAERRVIVTRDECERANGAHLRAQRAPEMRRVREAQARTLAPRNGNGRTP